MRRTTSAALTSMKRITELYVYVADQLTAEHAATQRASQQAALSTVTHAQQVALRQVVQAYLWALLGTLDQAGISIIEELNGRHPARHLQTEVKSRVDQINRKYGQSVQAILWR